MKPEQDSRLVIRLPSVSELGSSNKIGAFSYTWSHACFMVSVRGEGISEVPAANVCSLPKALFAGSAAPGSTLSLRVPRGLNRSLEVFAYFRTNATQACPTAQSLESFDPGSTVRVGQVASFSAQADEVNLNVEVALPPSGTNLISQYSLPATCAVRAVVPGPGSSTVVAGRGRQTGGNFVVQSVVSGRQSEKVLQGGSFVMKVTRRPGEE